MWRFSFFSSLVFTWTGAVWRLFHTLFVCSALTRLFSVTVCAHLLDLSPQERNFDARFHNTFTFSSFAQWSFSFFISFPWTFFLLFLSFSLSCFVCTVEIFAITSSVPAQQGSPLGGFFSLWLSKIIIQTAIQHFAPQPTRWNNFFFLSISRENWIFAGKLFLCVSGKTKTQEEIKLN